LEKIIKLLAVSHYLSIKQISEDGVLNEKEIKKLKGKLPFMKYNNLHRLLYETLGFERVFQ